MEEAVAVQHSDDRRGTEIDEALAGALRELHGRWLVRANAFEIPHREHATTAVLSIDRRKHHVRHVAEIRRECLRIVGFAPKVDLAQRVRAELANDASRLVPRDDELQDAAEYA